ncbi:hypothetical protein ACTG16_22795 [Aeromonas sp. 23P]|uniref:hypothetical protein n=1 Tax=Aeromonas sp. 23P TaxID=3452716 RepID=UPI003F7AD548|nr:hypothetical protein [Aeromonas veronii]
MTAATLISAAPVERDQFGFWTHPAIAPCDDERTDEQFRAYLLTFGINQIDWSVMYDDASIEVNEAYEKAKGGDCSLWQPTPPEGEGWITLSIHDTEEGPVCLWGRNQPDLGIAQS